MTAGRNIELARAINRSDSLIWFYQLPNMLEKFEKNHYLVDDAINLPYRRPKMVKDLAWLKGCFPLQPYRSKT